MICCIRGRGAQCGLEKELRLGSVYPTVVTILGLLPGLWLSVKELACDRASKILEGFLWLQPWLSMCIWSALSLLTLKLFVVICSHSLRVSPVRLAHPTRTTVEVEMIPLRYVSHYWKTLLTVTIRRQRQKGSINSTLEREIIKPADVLQSSRRHRLENLTDSWTDCFMKFYVPQIMNPNNLYKPVKFFFFFSGDIRSKVFSKISQQTETMMPF